MRSPATIKRTSARWRGGWIVEGTTLGREGARNMKGMENYARAIEFKGPAYLPCTVGADLDWLVEKDQANTPRSLHATAFKRTITP